MSEEQQNLVAPVLEEGALEIPAEPSARKAAASSGRVLSGGVSQKITGLRGGVAGWKLANWTALIPSIRIKEKELKDLKNDQLRKESLSLRYRAKSGEPLANLVVDAFALVVEAADRALGMRHFDVQLLGGMTMFHGAVAEMATGEGKTLTATLPMFLRALPGKGAMLATVNDYLAARDAEEMGQVFKLLGLTTGVITTDMSRPQRHEAYHCDITYGTAKEFGFDFLRDRLLLRQIRQKQLAFFDNPEEGGGEGPVQREHYYALVDEADSILIDDARTPLIISAIPGEDVEEIQATYRWAAGIYDRFEEDEHYEYDHEKKKVELLLPGRQLVRAIPKPPELDMVGLIDCYEYTERAIKVNRDFLLDQHYVVLDDEIVIVDESTGRLAEGRKWRDGIHQAIEAKEGVPITMDTGQAARITVQDFFMGFEVLGGMTGTAVSSAKEFRKIYKKSVCAIPTNRPPQRKVLEERVFGTGAEKWTAIAEEILELQSMGRPVLVGTRTIDHSHILSKLLTERGIEHQVLNAHQVALEAEIVAKAGERGRVTVATNMAGRGTDIKLPDDVAEMGGLHVICTEIHDSARIDRQLIGRCGRQGDPGSVRQYMSLDDEILLTGLGPKKALRLREQGKRSKGLVKGMNSLFRRAQSKVEARHLRDRNMLLHHEKQRKKMHRELGQDPYLDTPS